MKRIAKNEYGTYETSDLWYRRLPGVSHYYFGKIKKILCSWIEMGSGVALDFGCGPQRLKHYLPDGIQYIGYDIIPEYTDIDDYRKTNPDIFFSISSFEHLTHDELRDVLDWIATSNIKKAMVDLPINNNRYLFWNLMGLKKRMLKEHKHLESYNFENIHNALAKYLVLKRRYRYHNHILSEWVRK